MSIIDRAFDRLRANRVTFVSSAACCWSHVNRRRSAFTSLSQPVSPSHGRPWDSVCRHNCL